MTDINIISQYIFKFDLQQYTFYITPSNNIEKSLDIKINNILNNKNYTIYRYENGLLLEYLLIKYAKYNMKQIYKECQHIDIVHKFVLKGGKDKLTYNVKTILSNLLIDDHIIQNKQKLYFEMLKYNPKITKKYLMETYLLKDIKNINDVYILRPFGKFESGGGKNIYIVENTKQLNEIKQKININGYIATKYIINQLLFKNKKFHIRVPLMIININNHVTFSIFKHLRIVRANLPFINKDYNNTDIHDTHLKSTDDDYFFHDEFKNNKNYNDMISQIRLVITEYVKMIKNKIKPYDESKNAYKIFVCDFMITDDYIVKLLEINGINPIYKSFNVKNHDYEIMFNRDYFGWIFQKTVAPIFFPKLLLFNNDINITNKYYDIIRNNNILTIKLNTKCDDILIYYIIMINLLCPYKNTSKITILDLTRNNLWKNACDIIKCNYITNGKKYNLIICDNLENIDFKKYIIIEKFIEHESYKGMIKFNDKCFYIYKK